jgi:hypothetical protein
MLTPRQRHASTAAANRTECAAKELTKQLYQDTGYSNPLLIGKEKGRTNMYSVNNIVVALYDTHLQAEQGIKELQQCGFDMKRLSIVAKNPHVEEQVIGFYNAGDRMKQWGGQGAFWGGIWGLLFGAAFFAIPGLGPVLVAGPLVAWIVGALEGAVVVGGVSAIGAGLFSIGVPKDSVLKYDVALKTDKFLVLAHGTAEEAAKAQEILNGTHPSELHLHSLADAAAEKREPVAASV